jgi:hypothetical protein
MWRTRLTLKAGQRGTKNLQKKFGWRLICVRYRYDSVQKKRWKTVELLEEEILWEPSAKRKRWACVRIALSESALRWKIKAAGGIWDAKNRVWKIPLIKIKPLGLESRVVSNPRI